MLQSKIKIQIVFFPTIVQKSVVIDNNYSSDDENFQTYLNVAATCNLG